MASSRTFFAAIAALCTLSLVLACPGTPGHHFPPIVTHCKCEMNVVASVSCSMLQAEMIARIEGQKGWVDPHNGGQYFLDSNTSTSLKGHHITGHGHYTDLFDFYFNQTGGSCAFTACSESQVNSVLDASTNYCNLDNLYCGTDKGCKPVMHDIQVKEVFVDCTQHDQSKCVVTSTARETELA